MAGLFDAVFWGRCWGLRCVLAIIAIEMCVYGGREGEGEGHEMTGGERVMRIEMVCKVQRV